MYRDIGFGLYFELERHVIGQWLHGKRRVLLVRILNNLSGDFPLSCGALPSRFSHQIIKYVNAGATRQRLIWLF
jgi:hypothetical protein